MRLPERIVAIDVGGTNLKGAVVDRCGRASTVQRRSADRDAGPDAVIAAVVELACDLADPSAEIGANERPGAVGLAVPGIVDEVTGTVVTAANLRWLDVPIGPIVHERVGLEVAVSHDVRAGAVAEGLLGAAKGHRDYLFVTLGTGIGAAVVIDGRPHTGARGLGGELGHVAIERRGPLCGCGHPGCLEALASAGHIAARYGAMAGGERSVTTEEVARRAAAGDPVAAEIWIEALDALAVAIANYAALLDPELVVVGGGMAAAGDDLFVPLRERLVAHMRFGEPPPVVPAALGADAGRHGAAIAAWRTAGMQELELASWRV
jgi:glucokinase